MKFSAPAMARPRRLASTSRISIAHGFADQAEKLPRQIGRAPFARAGIHVEGEESVPVGLGEIGARHPLDLDPAFDRPLALAANGLPLA